MEKMKEVVKFKIFNKDEDEIEGFLRQLVIWNEKQLAEIIKRLNWILVNSGGTTSFQYFKLNGEQWRMGLVAANDFEIQKLISGTWTKQGKWFV